MKFTKPIVVVALLALLTSCVTTRMRHVSPERFIVEAKKIDEIHSIQSSSYIGSSNNRVYIEKQSLLTLSGQPKTTVFWTELDLLPKGMVNDLK